MVTPVARPPLARHWPIAVILAIAACLLFTNLGADHLWEDEGDTAVFARTILQQGLPVAWDGVTFNEADYGQRLKFGFVMVSHPWLQYYAAAGAFALLGESALAARLPFALAGLATILLLYVMVLRLVHNRRAALVAAVLLTGSVQFLLFSRQARNYSFNAALTCLLIWQFLRLDSRGAAVRFAVLGIVLFHAHAIGLFAVAALGALTLVYQPCASLRRWYWPAAVAIGLYALPWLLLSRSGHAQAMVPLDGLARFAPRVLQFAIEYASVAPIVGAGLLALVVAARRRIVRLTGEERTLIVSCAAIIGVQGVVMAATHTRNDLWVLGLHHTPALIPLTVLMVAILIARIAGRNRLALIALVLLFTFSRAGQVTPWAAAANPTPILDPEALATFHVPDRWTDRLLRTTQVQFIRSLTRSNPGTIANVSQWLSTHAEPGDVIVTNYEWEALYFHTRLPQAARISPSFPIYQVAKARALPAYVFDPERVRWIIWRRAWPAYFREQDLAALLDRLTRRGVTTTLAASIPETLYENRENIHFRRYPGQTYVFPWYMNLPDVHIYRVDWESDLEATHQRALADFTAGRLAETIAPFRRYLTERPDNAATRSRLGVALLLTGELTLALHELRRAAADAPGDGWVQRNLARALLDIGQSPGEALARARTALALRPDDPIAREVVDQALAALATPPAPPPR